MKSMVFVVVMLFPIGAAAQTYGVYSANPFAGKQVNPYQQPNAGLYNQNGGFAGNANNNQFDPNSTSNQFGRYGSQFSPDSVNNQFGRYGNQFSPDSPNNPFGQGLRVCGLNGCN